MFVEMFFSAYCPYCQRAKALLESKNVEIKFFDVDENPALWEESKIRSGRDTVPQIFIHGRHAGGCDDLYALENAGELDIWLAGSSNIA